MNDRSLLFTIFFVLIGPIKVIPAYQGSQVVYVVSRP